MAEPAASVTDLIRRVREGDEEAASQLVRGYEAEIRREVRARLRDPRLRQVLDSIDVCQSVLAEFFVRVALGQFAPQSPRELISLLVVMARNKVVDVSRRHLAARRDVRAKLPLDEAALDASRDPSPAEQVSANELVKAARGLLDDRERKIVELRVAGNSWLEIAAAMGGSVDAARKTMSRAMDRVSRRLKLSGEP